MGTKKSGAPQYPISNETSVTLTETECDQGYSRGRGSEFAASDEDNSF